MAKDPSTPNVKNADDSENPAVQGQPGPSGQDRQEQYQRSREHAASSQDEQDRDARIRRRAHKIWEQEGQPDGLAEQHWERAAQDLAREDAEIQREGIAGGQPGVKPSTGTTA